VRIYRSTLRSSFAIRFFEPPIFRAITVYFETMGEIVLSGVLAALFQPRR
jgi:hypothetical protein